MLHIGAIGVNARDYFSEGHSSGRVNSINCTGTETEILECDHVTSDRGLGCDAAGVVCQGTCMYTVRII